MCVCVVASAGLLQVSQDSWAYCQPAAAAVDKPAKSNHCILQTAPQINQDNWSSVDKLRQCIGGQQDDSDHPIMEAQLAAQKGNTSTGEGEVREGRAKPARGWGCRLFLLPTSHIDGVQSRTCGINAPFFSRNGTAQSACKFALAACRCSSCPPFASTACSTEERWPPPRCCEPSAPDSPPATCPRPAARWVSVGRPPGIGITRAMCAGFSTGNMPQACSKVGWQAVGRQAFCFSHRTCSALRLPSTLSN